jgi:hypothetical protein
MWRPMRFAWVLSLSCVACASSIEGAIDDETVPPMASSLLLQPDGLDAERDEIYVVTTTFPDACTLLTEQAEQRAEMLADLESGDDLDDARDDCSDFDEDNLPEDYWISVVSIRVADANKLDSGAVVGVDKDAANSSGAAHVCHQLGAPDFDNDADSWKFPAFLAVEGDSHRECYVAKEGEIDLGRFSDDELQIRAAVSLEDEDEDDVGDVVISTTATVCGDAEDAFDDWVRALNE